MISNNGENNEYYGRKNFKSIMIRKAILKKQRNFKKQE